MKHTVKLTIGDNIYHNIMFMLKNLQLKDLKIEEIKEDISVLNTKDKMKKLFESNKIDAFKTIDEPMQWQKNQRDEW